MDRNTFRLTLNQHLWALTRVWVVPLSEQQLTRRPLLPPSKMTTTSEFDKKARDFSPVLPNQYLYTVACLR
jgi:hypothetical protein